MTQPNIREQAAMDAIFGPVANTGLPGIDRNLCLLSEIREAMGAEVTADYSDLPRRVREMSEAIKTAYRAVRDVNDGLLGAKTAAKHLDGVLGQVLYVMQVGSGRGR